MNANAGTLSWNVAGIVGEGELVVVHMVVETRKRHSMVACGVAEIQANVTGTRVGTWWWSVVAAVGERRNQRRQEQCGQVVRSAC